MPARRFVRRRPRVGRPRGRPTRLPTPISRPASRRSGARTRTTREAPSACSASVTLPTAPASWRATSRPAPTLILDGEANGAGDTLLRQDSLDRPSANPESFDFRNSGAGALTLSVDGVDVVTTATDQDTLGALSCPDGQIAKRVSGAWQCANDADSDTTYLAGNQLQLTGSTFDVLEGPASGLDADTVDGLDSSALATAAHGHFGASWTGVGAALTIENLGTTGNLSSLVSRTYTETGAAVYGLHGHPTAGGFGLYGLSDSSQGIGVQGIAARYGVRGISTAPATGYGVVGLAIGNSGAGTFGGAYNATGDMVGVLGVSSQSADGAGVKGESQATSGSTQGVWGVAASPSGAGVRGQATATTGATRGVQGETASAAGGIGVYGKATSATGLNFGVVGEAPSPDSIGVHGLATSTLGNPWGVYGETRSTSTNGVNPRATAVYGLATGTSGDALGVAGGSASLFGAGIYGFNSAGGLAGYFQGNVHVNGTLSKAGGSFKIDHPLDPENRYLSHSFVESPDMLNLYNGNATLDAQRRGVGRAAGLVRGAEPRLPLPADAVGLLVGALDRTRSRGEPISDPRRRTQPRLLASDRCPTRRLGRGASDPDRGGEAGRRARPLSSSRAWGQPAEKGLHRLEASVASARTEGVLLESSAPAAPAAFAHALPPLPQWPGAGGRGPWPAVARSAAAAPGSPRCSLRSGRIAPPPLRAPCRRSLIRRSARRCATSRARRFSSRRGLLRRTSSWRAIWRSRGPVRGSRS